MFHVSATCEHGQHQPTPSTAPPLPYKTLPAPETFHEVTLPYEYPRFLFKSPCLVCVETRLDSRKGTGLKLFFPKKYQYTTITPKEKDQRCDHMDALYYRAQKNVCYVLRDELKHAVRHALRQHHIELLMKYDVKQVSRNVETLGICNLLTCSSIQRINPTSFARNLSIHHNAR